MLEPLFERFDIPAEVRRGMVADLVANGVPADKANECVDLGIHAVADALVKIDDICRTATHWAVRMTAVQIALSITKQQADRLGDVIATVAAEHGAITMEHTFTLKGSKQ